MLLLAVMWGLSIPVTKDVDVDPDDVVIYDAAELATMMGRSTSELPGELRRPAVHADDLVTV